EFKNDLIGLTTHDLRNPISAISGYLTLVLDGAEADVLNQDQKRFLERSKGACEKMLRLIGDVLDVTLIENGRLKLKKQKVNLSGFLNEVYQEHKCFAQARGVALVLDLPVDLPDVEMDPERISQVLHHLLTNAVRFSEKETSIRLTASAEESKVRISVEDHGKGIPEREFSKLFQFFSRTSTMPSDGESNSGLGLAIVKKLVQMHQGTVRVESRVSQGSVFSFSIPLKTGLPETS
ncbi:HAMP domain-containing histidine kinase, partial [Omnitrophica bacterium]|nr:HAMP domain-containing histidine kinase [Candidatus Omnitrophota bacterium]